MKRKKKEKRMKRFSLFGKIGPDEKVEDAEILQADSVIHEIDMFDIEGGCLGFGIGKALHDLAELGLEISEKAIDLVVLAALVNAGDSKISRSGNAQDGWTREIDLYVPVSEPDGWTVAREHIEGMLRFLTGDIWRVRFRPRVSNHQRLATLPMLPQNNDQTVVSLLSGGLDSLIGAIDQLSEGKDLPLFISHHWDTVTLKAQDYVYQKLKEKFGSKNMNRVQVKLGFNKNELRTEETEPSQRGRSFLFYSLATLAASALEGQTEVRIPENGFIALNVPLDQLRLGALSTKTAHPHFLKCMVELAEIMKLSVSYSNPYRFQTKGEMVANCTDLEFLKNVVKKSMSCSAPAKLRFYQLKPGHCGYCVPCLIRRAALKHGLGTEDPTWYFINDLQAKTLETMRAEGEHVWSFMLMAMKIKKDPGLAKFLVHDPGPLGTDTREFQHYADVFRRGILEVDKLLDGVKTTPGK